MPASAGGAPCDDAPCGSRRFLEQQPEQRTHGQPQQQQLCQSGRQGTHRALDRLQRFSRSYRYVLRMNIVQHFPSIDHQILRETLARVIKDDNALWLIDRIQASGAGVLKAEYSLVWFPGDDLFAPLQRPRGLPIGNLTA